MSEKENDIIIAVLRKLINYSKCNLEPKTSKKIIKLPKGKGWINKAFIDNKKTILGTRQNQYLTQRLGFDKGWVIEGTTDYLNKKQAKNEDKERKYNISHSKVYRLDNKSIVFEEVFDYFYKKKIEWEFITSDYFNDNSHLISEGIIRMTLLFLAEHFINENNSNEEVSQLMKKLYLIGCPSCDKEYEIAKEKISPELRKISSITSPSYLNHCFKDNNHFEEDIKESNFVKNNDYRIVITHIKIELFFWYNDLMRAEKLSENNRNLILSMIQLWSIVEEVFISIQSTLWEIDRDYFQLDEEGFGKLKKEFKEVIKKILELTKKEVYQKVEKTKKNKTGGKK
jgi:hypothetical protein